MSGGLIFVTAIRTKESTGDVSRVKRWLHGSGEPHHQVTLHELSPDAAKELVRAIRTEGLDEEQLCECLKGAGGVPLLLIHSARERDWGCDGKDSAERPTLSASHPLQAMLAARLRGLSWEGVQVLEVLAVAFRQLDAAVGERVSDLDEGEWWAALSELEDRFLISWNPEGPTVRHDLIRRYVVSNMGEARWRCLNRRMG
jgi:hypothetical protein